MQQAAGTSRPPCSVHNTASTSYPLNPNPNNIRSGHVRQWPRACGLVGNRGRGLLLRSDQGSSVHQTRRVGETYIFYSNEIPSSCPPGGAMPAHVRHSESPPHAKGDTGHACGPLLWNLQGTDQGVNGGHQTSDDGVCVQDISKRQVRPAASHVCLVTGFRPCAPEATRFLTMCGLPDIRTTATD
jgi:hypothetical protein